MNNPFKYKLSIIIVNYNVEYFLEQCLNSVFQALTQVEGEVFVVDNNSVDGSVEMVREKFPQVKLIANKDNRGFSKANNQAIELSQGEYILLLNPDTIVEEDTFQKVVAFMDEHPNAGGLGVRMLDGKGKFLPESKRGLPTPAVAFYKIFGLSTFFPKSKLFGRYHLGYLSEFETHEVDVLSGAFMLMRKEVLDEVGLLDETFFMYGEDIDLSYRIQQGGYKNYYFPKTRIIHYKGESTKKSSVNYVFVFYRAMVIFAQKHFSQKNAKLFSFLINLAIYFRASLAILARFIKQSILPLLDVLLIGGGLFTLTNYWRLKGIEFPEGVIETSIPIYTMIWMLSVFLNEGYDTPLKLKRYLKAPFLGTLLILVIYALIPKSWQFSRLFILIGTVWVSCYYILSRIYLHIALGKSFSLLASKSKRFVVVGDRSECDRVAQLIRETNSSVESIYFISQDEKEYGFVGELSQLDQVVEIYNIDEVIFSAKNIPAKNIIEWMSKIQRDGLDFKIAQPDSFYLIGSNSIETAGDLYVLNINAITLKSNIRLKRFLDVIVGGLMCCFAPVLYLLMKERASYFSNALSLLIGKKSVVGYQYEFTSPEHFLPKIKQGVLSPLVLFSHVDEQVRDKINLIYARDFSVWKDVQIIKKAWRNLGRKC